MLDNQALKNQLPSVVESLAQRGFFFDTQRFLQLEQARKAEQTALEQYQARRKQLAKDIGILKMQGKDAQHLLDEANHLNTQLDETSPCVCDNSSRIGAVFAQHSQSSACQCAIRQR